MPLLPAQRLTQGETLALVMARLRWGYPQKARPSFISRHGQPAHDPCRTRGELGVRCDPRQSPDLPRRVQRGAVTSSPSSGLIQPSAAPLPEVHLLHPAGGADRVPPEVRGVRGCLSAHTGDYISCRLFFSLLPRNCLVAVLASSRGANPPDWRQRPLGREGQRRLGCGDRGGAEGEEKPAGKRTGCDPRPPLQTAGFALPGTGLPRQHQTARHRRSQPPDVSSGLLRWPRGSQSRHAPRLGSSWA